MTVPAMPRRDFLTTLGLGASAAGLAGLLPAREPRRRPNLLLVMADDMGFSDLGCYGGEIETPHLDALAAGGLRFTQFYNTARCCPSRASLLTGLYPHQAGVGWMVGDQGFPGYRGRLSEDCVTLAEVLREAGYSTLMAGKWHVGERRPHWPVDRGFQEFYGLVSGGSNYWKLDRGRTFARNDESIVPDEPGFYMTDAFTNAALGFLDCHAGGEKPFFLYLAYTAPHWPLHAWPEDIARYQGRYLKGWDALRRERHARMIEMGLVEAGWPLTPRDPQAPPWDGLDAEKQSEMDLRMAIYAAQITCMDRNLGRVFRKLRELGAWDNTLILFLSDNGACAETGPFGFDRAEGPLGTVDSFSSYGLSWANAGNTPFRRYKHWVHEGGIATPLIAHWPGVIRDGGLSHEPGHIIDLPATCLDAAGARYPRRFAGRAIRPIEGKSLLPIFTTGKRRGHEALFWEHEGNRAVRQGDWKLVSLHPGDWELYNLRQDRTELHDLAAEHPRRVRSMARLYEAWAERSQVRPWPVRAAAASEARRFVLRPGDALVEGSAPRLAATPFTVQAALAGPGDGVVVAQGGSRDGFALFVEAGRPAFAIRRAGLVTTAQARVPLPSGPAQLAGRLDKDGTLSLSLDGRVVGRVKGPGLIPAQPTEGLTVGRDTGNAVGPYAPPFPFTGSITEVSIALDP